MSNYKVLDILSFAGQSAKLQKVWRMFW
jgi:hypothetical protein